MACASLSENVYQNSCVSTLLLKEMHMGTQMKKTVALTFSGNPYVNVIIVHSSVSKSLEKCLKVDKIVMSLENVL